MKFFLGIVGFCCFETLRIYKRIWAGLPVPPLASKKIYTLALVVLAILSGTLAHFLTHGNIAEAIFIGFSVPTGLKALTDGPRSGQVIVDDIEVKKPTYVGKAITYVRAYFQFRKS